MSLRYWKMKNYTNVWKPIKQDNLQSIKKYAGYSVPFGTENKNVKNSPRSP